MLPVCTNYATMTNVDTFVALMSFVFFPDDGDKDDLNSFHKTMLFAQEIHQNMSTQGEDADIYVKHQVVGPSLTSMYQVLGIDFTNQYFTEVVGVPVSSAYPEVFAPFSDGCTLLSVVSVSKYICWSSIC